MSRGIDNLSVAAMQLVNEIALKNGLQPYQFVAAAKHREDGAWIISFESPPDPGAERGFWRMMKSLGLDGAHMELEGTEEEIWQKLICARSAGWLR